MDTVIELVHKTLQKYNKIILVTRLVPQNVWSRFCNGLVKYKEESANFSFLFILEEGVSCPGDFCSITVSHEEAQELYKLYLTYEFSNRFEICSDNMRYGTIFNYVDTGIMTEEEAVNALLI